MAAVAEDFAGVDVEQLRPLGEVRKGYTAFVEGDVLLAKITPCMENGKGGLVPALPKGVAYGSTEFHVLRPSVALRSKWLSHFLSQPAFRKVARANMTGTAGQMRVPAKWLQTVGLPIPPLAEQSRIVAKLEELLSDLDAGVAELKAAQKKLAQYRQSLLKAAVEGRLTEAWRAQHRPTETGAQLLDRILTERRARWEAKQLAKFQAQGKTPPKDWQKKYPEPVRPDTSGLPELPEGWGWATIDQLSFEQRYGSSAKTDEAASGVPVLRMGNLREGRLDLRSLKYLPENHDEFPQLFLEDGDLLFNRTNSAELVGKTAVYRLEVVPCSFASYLISVRFSPGYLPELASAFINSTYGRDWIKSVAVQQVGQANVNGSKLSALAIPVPPFAEQQEIVRNLGIQTATAFYLESNIDRSLKQSTAQRQNILRAAFSGQLVPQDPNDEPASVLLERVRAERAAQGAVKKPRGRKAREMA
jgi:type I restriction enzyme, S subunit